MPQFAATERLGNSIAPVGLLLTQELVNTEGPPSYGIDLLAGPETAQNWLDTALAGWQAANPHTVVPEIPLSEAGLTQLRVVRTSLHRFLAREGDASPLNAPVSVTAGPDGVKGTPVGAGPAWICSAVALELFQAEQHDLIRRLKLCRDPLCATAFYDLSKNNSRIWHDVATCGNRANARAYRARQRVEG